MTESFERERREIKKSQRSIVRYGFGILFVSSLISIASGFYVGLEYGWNLQRSEDPVKARVTSEDPVKARVTVHESARCPIRPIELYDDKGISLGRLRFSERQEVFGPNAFSFCNYERVEAR